MMDGTSLGVVLPIPTILLDLHNKGRTATSAMALAELQLS